MGWRVELAKACFLNGDYLKKDCIERQYRVEVIYNVTILLSIKKQQYRYLKQGYDLVRGFMEI